jgi:hypothetical protein
VQIEQWLKPLVLAPGSKANQEHHERPVQPCHPLGMAYAQSHHPRKAERETQKNSSRFDERANQGLPFAPRRALPECCVARCRQWLRVGELLGLKWGRGFRGIRSERHSFCGQAEDHSLQNGSFPQGELGALRWLDCDFETMSFSLQHSYYWRRRGHLKCTKTEASAKLLPMHPSLKYALLEWKSQTLYNQPEHFIFPSERLKGNKLLDLASVLKKKVQPAFKRIGITGVGWHTFRHTVGTMLAEMGEHQLTMRDYLRHRTSMSQTSTCRRHRRPNDWRRTNWSTLFCRRVFCPRQT